MMWLEKVHLQSCKGFSNCPVVFWASTVRKNSIKRRMTQSLDSPAEICPLFPVRANHWWSLSDRWGEWERTTRRFLCSGPPVRNWPLWSGARFLFSPWLTCPLWAILRYVRDELSDDLRHIICLGAEDPFLLTDHHMNIFFWGGSTPPSPVSMSFTQKRVAFIH